MQQVWLFVLALAQGGEEVSSSHAGVPGQQQKAEQTAPESQQSCPSVQKLRIGLEWFVNADHMPLFLAQELGFFEDLGLDVELVEPADHWVAEREILEGRLDVAVTEPLHLAKDAAEGNAMIGFARFLHTDGGVMYFDPHIKRPRDMCGKRIQYPGAPGPGGPAIVQTMVEHDGGECDLSSYGTINYGFDHVQALADGQADVATLIFSNFEIPAAVAAGHPEAKYFSLKEHGVPDFCQLVLVTTPQRFAALKPHLRKLVLALRKAVTLVHKDPESAVSLFSSQYPDLPLDTVKATLPMFPNDNSLAPDYFSTLMAWLVRTGQVDTATARAVPPDVYWSNDIALP